MKPEERARNICEMPYPASGYGSKSHDLILKGRIQQAIDAAILEEREACAKIVADTDPNMDDVERLIRDRGKET